MQFQWKYRREMNNFETLALVWECSESFAAKNENWEQCFQANLLFHSTLFLIVLPMPGKLKVLARPVKKWCRLCCLFCVKILLVVLAFMRRLLAIFRGRSSSSAKCAKVLPWKTWTHNLLCVDCRCRIGSRTHVGDTLQNIYIYIHIFIYKISLKLQSVLRNHSHKIADNTFHMGKMR